MTTATRARDLFLSVHELPPRERTALLERECTAGGSVWTEVESLLQAYDGRQSLLRTGQSPAARVERLGAAQQGMPAQVGPYVIQEKIGAGGMGVVFRAEQAFPRRTVALKVMRLGGVDDSWSQRFRNEIETLGRLHHQGIAQVYDAGILESDFGDQPWFAMELVDGTTIGDFVGDQDLDLRARCELVARICDAVQHAHERGVIHRDLKPGNVIVSMGDDRTPQPKLLDFGVARTQDDPVAATTLTGQPVGTLPYMSPEQLAGDRPVDARTDIYALGVIFYELMTGRRPADVDDRGFHAFVRRVTQVEPRRLGQIDSALKGDLETIATTALAKDPGQRYQSARAMAQDLRRFCSQLPIQARRPTTFYRMRRFTSRNKALVGGVATTLLVLCVGVVVSMVFAVRAVRNEHAARMNAYAVRMTQAMAMVRTDPLGTEDHLDRTAPEFRGFEWHYIKAQIDERAHSLAEDWGAATAWEQQCAIAYPRGRGPLYLRARGSELCLIDLASGEILRRLRGPALSCPKVSSDGARVAAWSSTATGSRLLAWDVATAERLVDLAVPSARPVPYAMSDDGRVLAVNGWNGAGAFVAVDTGAVTLTGRLPWTDKTDPPEPTFLGGGSRVAIGGRIFDCRTGKLVRLGAAPEHVWQIVQAGGGTLASARWRRRRVDLLDAESGKILRLLPGLRSHARWLAFSPDGRRLAAAGYSGTVVVWDVERGVTLRAFVDRAVWLAFNADGTRLAACTSKGPVEWDLESTGARELVGHPTYVYLVGYSPDGRLVASVDHGGDLVLWSARTGRLLREFRTGKRAQALRFSHDGARITLLGPPHRAWLTANGAPLPAEECVAPGRPAVAPGEIGAWDAVSRDGSLHAVATKERVFVRRADGTEVARLVLPHRTSAGGGRVARTRADLERVHFMFAPSIAICPRNRRVAVGRSDGSVHLFDIATGRYEGGMQRHFGPVYDVDFSPDGRRVASGGNDGTIRIWDTESHEQVGVLRGHKSYVKSLAFRPDGKQLASASGDGTVRLWDAAGADSK